MNMPIGYRWLVALGSGYLALVSMSCDDEPGCEALCERQAACPDQPADCVASCREGRDRAEANGCPDSFHALASCLEESDDVCNADCDAETSTFISCTCPNGGCLETSSDCAHAATTGTSGSCTVIGICGELTLSLDCRGSEEPCSCLDADGAVVKQVPYDPAFCSDDVAAQGDAAAAACGW